VIQLDLEGGDQFSSRVVELQSKRGRVILIATENENATENTFVSPSGYAQIFDAARESIELGAHLSFTSAEYSPTK
jgi:hypothetical protein